jgi:hypothetical protein
MLRNQWYGVSKQIRQKLKSVEEKGPQFIIKKRQCQRIVAAN